jgi:hypothetical protein
MADQDVFYHELVEAMEAGGCPMCRLARKASDSYLNALIYEGVIDVGVRDKLRNARGLCYRHAWRIARRRGSVLGVSIIYSDVVNTLVKALEAQADAPTRLFSRGHPDLARGLAAEEECPACVLEHDANRRHAKTLLRHLDSEEIATGYVATGGLCLPHFQLVLSHASAGQTKTLAAWQAEAWRKLRGELDELIRKHDYRFREEVVGEDEADSWERAVSAIIGDEEHNTSEEHS